MATRATWLTSDKVFEVGKHLGGFWYQRAIANWPWTEKSPQVAKGQQTKDRVATVEVPLDGGERHELTEVPPSHHDCGEYPMPQSCHRVPNFLPVQLFQAGLLFFAEVVVATFTRITDATDLGTQGIEPVARYGR